MKCFEVTINGKKVCTAGVGDDGVFTAIVALVKAKLGQMPYASIAQAMSHHTHEHRLSALIKTEWSALRGTTALRFPAGGEYMGLDAAPDGSFQLLWSDARSGVYQLRTATVRVKRKLSTN
jgi:hypothetical protein